MPADDLVLNVRQIAQYTPVSSAPSTASLLMQLAGIGSAYGSISPQALVSTALSQGGSMAIAGQLGAASVQAGSGQFSNLAVNLLSAQKACVVEFDATWGSIGGVPIATQAYADALHAASVQSFNGRTGAVCLWIQDILNAGGAPLWSPVFGGEPRAPTPAPNSCNSRLATTKFVQRCFIDGFNGVLAKHPFVFTFNGRSGDIVLTAEDIIAAGGEGEIFNNPVFTGIPIAPTAPPGTSTDQIATTAFVMNAVGGGPFAPINSPVFTGVPQGPTAAAGSSTGQLATTAFVMNAVAESVTGVASFNTRTGNVVLAAADITGAGGALLASPAFTGNPTAPTPPPGDNDTTIATTAYVTAALAVVSGGVSSFNTRTGAVSLTTADITGAGGATLTSPTFNGVPAAPTAGPNTNTTQIATCAFVMSELTNAAVVSFNGRQGAVTLTSADISAAGGAALQSPAFLGTPTAPTAVLGTNSNQIATTAFVTAALTGAGVTSFNGRSGAVTLALTDVTAVGGAPLASPSFSGTPTGPTAAPGNSSQQLATTQFVTAALAGGAGVSSFNTRTGAVTLTIGDITAAGGAPIGSPVFTGSPAAPTPTAGNSSTALATTAFVQTAIATASVASFNGRVGAVTLNSADVSAAGGALLAGPAFTGAPTAPTAAPGTNSGQLATTAFVVSAVNAAGGVTSFNGRAGVVQLQAADITGAGGAVLASPAFTGTPNAPTATAGTNTTQLATCAFVAAALSATGFLPLSGGTLTGAIAINGGNAPQLIISPPAGQSASLTLNRVNATVGNQLIGMTNNSLRWVLSMGSATAETGSNAGSNFALTSYSDAGVALATPFQVIRSNGSSIFSNYVNVGGMGVMYGNYNSSHFYAIVYNTSNGYPQLYTDGASTGWIITSNPNASGYVGGFSLLLNSAGTQMTYSYVGGAAVWPCTLSDRRLKSNLKLSQFDALAALRKLKVWDCDMRGVSKASLPLHWDCALIADEVEQVVPRAFMKGVDAAPSRGDDKTPSTVYDSLDVLPLVATLVKAVQQLAARLDDLTAPKGAIA